MTQSCTDAPIEGNFKAEKHFTDGKDKTFLVRALCMQISFLYIVGSVMDHR